MSYATSTAGIPDGWRYVGPFAEGPCERCHYVYQQPRMPTAGEAVCSSCHASASLSEATLHTARLRVERARLLTELSDAHRRIGELEDALFATSEGDGNMTTNGTAMVQAGPGLARANERADLSIRFTTEQRKVILDTCCGGASESEAAALIAIAELRGLNPVLGECYFVKRYDTATRRDVWAVQASIDSLRIKAEQTGLYAGQDEPEYEYDAKGNVTLARVRVWRKDWPRPAVAVARWSEYVQLTKEQKPTRFWAKMPHNQLAKCAEALALRKAFPAVLGKLYVSEEMEQAENDAPRLEAPSRPQLPPPDDRVYRELCDRVDAAERPAALNKIAADTLRAEKDGKITTEQRGSIARACNKKADLLKGAATERKSEPKEADEAPPEIDGDGVVCEREPGSDDE